MIYVQVIGGLGNQIFQYAFARRLSIERNIPFKLDISGFEKYPLRRYALNVFNIVEQFALPGEIDRLKPRRYPLKPELVLYRKLQDFKYQRTWIREQYPYRYEKFFFRSDRDVYLEGYWQNEG